MILLTMSTQPSTNNLLYSNSILQFSIKYWTYNTLQSSYMISLVAWDNPI